MFYFCFFKSNFHFVRFLRLWCTCKHKPLHAISFPVCMSSLYLLITVIALESNSVYIQSTQNRTAFEENYFSVSSPVVVIQGQHGPFEGRAEESVRGLVRKRLLEGAGRTLASNPFLFTLQAAWKRGLCQGDYILHLPFHWTVETI